MTSICNFIKVYLLTGVFIYSFSLSFTFGQDSNPSVITPWENLVDFTISQSEDYLVVTLKILGKNQLYESNLVNGVWSDLKPIDTINKHHGEGFDVEGPFLSYNSQNLYFQANFPDSKGGFDIYHSERGPSGWGKPVNAGEIINTVENEMYPSLTPAGDKLFFARTIVGSDFRKPRDIPDCQRILMTAKNSRGEWELPIVLHDLINRGCEYGPKVAFDGRTLVFSSVDATNYREGYNIYFTREIMEDNWLDAQLVSGISSEETNLFPQIAGDNIYFIRRTIQKRQEISSLYRVAIPQEAKPLPTIASKGKVLSLRDAKPIDAELIVYNPTTLQELGRFKSNSQTGEFEMPLLDFQNYIVDVRKQGYSFASFMIDYRQEEKQKAPELIELFEDIELDLTVFDNENFRPIQANIIVENTKEPNKKYQGQMVSEGIYALKLPIGNEYIVKGTNVGFDDNQFIFNLTGDVIFSRFERSLALTPVRRVFEIVISDSETQEGVAAEVLITNLNREEVIIFSAQDIKDGKITAMLREGDQYEFTVRGAQGYSFFNQVVDLQKQETSEIKAELVSLKAETSIRLNNINFQTNSAELSSESFPELNRVVQLIVDNPNIVIEISAHTDNIGSVSLNKLLSDRRAQSVVNYLLDNGVSQDRLVARGYGLTKPMVPNTSDENRALNRRVEFKILDILEDE